MANNTFSTVEGQKALEALLAEIAKSKRELPISFATKNGSKQVEPILLNLNNMELSDKDKEKKAKRYNIEVGTKPVDGGKSSTGYFNIDLTVEKHKYLNSENKEATFEIPSVGQMPLDELFRLARDLSEITLAVRNLVITSLATNPRFIENSTVEPPTGVILADILVNSGRLQSQRVKEIMSETIDPTKLNAYISQYNMDKSSKKLIEAIGYITLKKFAEGCDEAANIIKNIEEQGINATPVPESTSTDPVTSHQRESKMEQVQDRVKQKRNLRSFC